jgi:hypothetical protein
VDDRIASMPAEPDRFGESSRKAGSRVADIVAAVVLWAGVCGLALLNGFWFLWYLAWSGTFSASSCSGRADRCDEEGTAADQELLLLGAVVIPMAAVVTSLVLAVLARRRARRRFPPSIWPLLAVGGQALCLCQALS